MPRSQDDCRVTRRGRGRSDPTRKPTQNSSRVLLLEETRKSLSKLVGKNGRIAIHSGSCMARNVAEGPPSLSAPATAVSFGYQGDERKAFLGAQALGVEVASLMSLVRGGGRRTIGRAPLKHTGAKARRHSKVQCGWHAVAPTRNKDVGGPTLPITYCPLMFRRPLVSKARR